MRCFHTMTAHHCCTQKADGMPMTVCTETYWVLDWYALYLLCQQHAVCCCIPEACIECIELMGSAAHGVAPALLKHKKGPVTAKQ